jgi:hypothetical protein
MSSAKRCFQRSSSAAFAPLPAKNRLESARNAIAAEAVRRGDEPSIIVTRRKAGGASRGGEMVAFRSVNAGRMTTI